MWRPSNCAYHSHDREISRLVGERGKSFESVGDIAFLKLRVGELCQNFLISSRNTKFDTISGGFPQNHNHICQTFGFHVLILSPLSDSPIHSHLSSQTLNNAVRSHSSTDRDFVYRSRIMGNATEEMLQRFSAIAKNTSVLKIFFPESTEKSVALSDIGRAYLSLCVKVHPDKGGSDNIELATRCTQKISKCFELCKGYADSHETGSSCFILETITFTGFENRDYLHCEKEECSSPEGFGDDFDNIFESFFPSDEGESMRVNNNRESDEHRPS